MFCKRVCILFILMAAVQFVTAQTNVTTVFESGTEGHKIYRIPAIVGLPNKNLLAFCEARKWKW